MTSRHHLTLHATIALLLATPAFAAEPAEQWTTTNRLSLSVRFGFGISTRVKGIGGNLHPSAPAAGGRLTPEGDAYNYDDGYVLTDVSGNAGDMTWYWGYDSSSQISGDNLLFNRTTAANLPGSLSKDADPAIGVELTYNRQLGVKENWRNLRYGLEGAVNYTPICVEANHTFNTTLTRATDSYAFTSGTTPPAAPYQGSFNGPGFVIGSIPSTSTSLIPDTIVIERYDFEGNLWGARLGPYIEMPVSRRLTTHFSGGLAAGLLDSRVSWQETVTIPGEGTTTVSGESDEFNALLGFYLSAEATYRLNHRWSVLGGVQFQNLGKVSHQFGRRAIELDLSQSFFGVFGISYNF